MEYPWHKPESLLGVQKRVPNKGIVAVNETKSDLEHWNSVQQTSGVCELFRKTLFLPSVLLLIGHDDGTILPPILATSWKQISEVNVCTQLPSSEANNCSVETLHECSCAYPNV